MREKLPGKNKGGANNVWEVVLRLIGGGKGLGGKNRGS